MSDRFTVRYRVTGREPGQVQLTPTEPGGLDAPGKPRQMRGMLGKDSIRFPDVTCAGLAIGDEIVLAVKTVKRAA